MPLTLEQVDADGAIRETMDAVQGDTRAAFLAKAGLPRRRPSRRRRAADAHGGRGAGAGPGRSDVSILNYALTLEYLEAAFYTEAVRKGALAASCELFARVAGGARARARRRRSSQVLGPPGREAAAVQLPRHDREPREVPRHRDRARGHRRAGLRRPGAARQGDAVLEAALAIHTVEARHAAWIRDIAGEDPAPRAFDRPLTQRRCCARSRSTRFIRG